MPRQAQRVSNVWPGLLAGLAGMLLLATSARAQDAGQLHPGARVRIWYGAGEQRYEGRLVSLSRDSLVVALAIAGEPLTAIPRDKIGRVWVQTAGHRKTLVGLGVGLGVGATVGAAVGAAAYEPCTGECFIDFGRGVSALAGAVVFGGAGLLVGGIAGFCTHGQNWQPVALPVTAVSLTPAGRGLGLAVRARL